MKPTDYKKLGSRIQYKQTYRKAWELVPEFKNWLRPVENHPNKAYCCYCDKLLHAHRISLFKHTCTSKHEKAAEILMEMSNKSIQTDNRLRKDVVISKLEQDTITHKINVEKRNHPVEQHLIEINDTGMQNVDEEFVEEHDGDTEVNEDVVQQVNQGGGGDMQSIDESEEDYTHDSYDDHEQEENNITSRSSGLMTSPVTTHILDTSVGRPAANVQITLYQLVDGQWSQVSEGRTNNDGRLASLMTRSNFTEGCYKLQFHVSEYFELKGISAFYPFIDIVFNVADADEHYHVPLLLTPFGYSTYRGS